MRKLLVFGSFAHDSQSVLTAVHRLALVLIKLPQNVGLRVQDTGLELSIAAFTNTYGWQGDDLYDPQCAFLHENSLAPNACANETAPVPAGAVALFGNAREDIEKRGVGDRPLGSFFDSVPLEYRKINPSSKERADATTQQMENFMDITDLKQLMKRVLDHSEPPICAIIRRVCTLRTLLVFRGFTHDPQVVLAAVYGLALVGIELCQNPIALC
jgi:hypothetical protein